MRMVEGKRSRTALPFAKPQHGQTVGLTESSLHCGEQELTTREKIGAVRRMTKHFNAPSVDRFPSCRSPVARRIIMMKQHGRQQGRSFLPHGLKDISV